MRVAVYHGIRKSKGGSLHQTRDIYLAVADVGSEIRKGGGYKNAELLSLYNFYSTMG